MPDKDCKPLPHLTAGDIARFWSKVDRRDPDDCWLWRGTITAYGYGHFWTGGGQLLVASRVALYLTSGVDPFPLNVLHSCDVRYPIGDPTSRRCCNPEHLFKGTDADNVADMKAKGRQARGDRHGSRLHPERMARGDRHGSRTHPEKILRGASHPRNGAKLTPDEIVQIRDLYSRGDIMQRTLAEQFGVLPGAISRIVNRKRWPHVV